MANHAGACQESKDLCQRLVRALKEKIPDLIYQQGHNKCSLSVPGARRIPVWVNSHGSRDCRINVWFLGKPMDRGKYKELYTRPRSETTGSWKEYGGSFMIEDARQLEEAVAFLVAVSFPAAREQFNQDTARMKFC